MTTYYVDSVNGNDANAGTSEALAKITLSAGCALLTAAGDILYVQAGGNYTLTSSVNLTQDGDTTGGRILIEGYTTTPGAKDGRPVITTATNSTALIIMNGANKIDFVHLKFTNTAATRAAAFSCETAASTSNRWIDCVFDGVSTAHTNNGAAFSNSIFLQCEVKNCTSASIAAINSPFLVYGCFIYSNACDGIYSSYERFYAIGNVITNNPRYGISEGTGSGNGSAYIIERNTIANNTSDGIRVTFDTIAQPLVITNNIFYGNGGYGQNWTNLSSGENLGLTIINRNNAYGSNTTAARNGITAGTGDVTLSGNPFTNSGAYDYSLDSTSGEGAACRAAGIVGAFPGGLFTSYPDIGAVQHADPAGGGLASNPIRGFIG
jgi:hypothetical protein